MPLRMIIIFMLVFLAYGIWEETGGEENVFLELEKKEFSAEETLKLTLLNQESFEIWLGKPYSIEKYTEGEWERVPLDLVFTMELITLPPGEAFIQQVPLEGLKPGRYRIVKSVTDPEKEKPQGIYSEFRIIEQGS